MGRIAKPHRAKKGSGRPYRRVKKTFWAQLPLFTDNELMRLVRPTVRARVPKHRDQHGDE